MTYFLGKQKRNLEFYEKSHIEKNLLIRIICISALRCYMQRLGGFVCLIVILLWLFDAHFEHIIEWPCLPSLLSPLGVGGPFMYSLYEKDLVVTCNELTLTVNLTGLKGA